MRLSGTNTDTPVEPALFNPGVAILYFFEVVANVRCEGRMREEPKTERKVRVVYQTVDSSHRVKWWPNPAETVCKNSAGQISERTLSEIACAKLGEHALLYSERVYVRERPPGNDELLCPFDLP